MRLLLIMPWERSYRLYRDWLSPLLVYPPLTLTTLAALVPPELNAEVHLCDEFSQTPEQYGGFYDVVVLSFTTPSARRAYALARHYRSQGSHVVMGGYHPSFLPEEAQVHCDTVIVGPGEVAWPRFLKAFAAGRAERRYEHREVPPEAFVAPRRDLLEARGYMAISPLQVNGGCHNRCDYCAIGQMWRPAARPVPQVMAELRAQRQKRVVFFDPNFFQDREYSLELLGRMKGLGIRWGCNATVENGFDGELLAAARDAGCAGMLLGFESFSSGSLAGVNKRINDPGRYREAVERIHRHGINVNGCFVLGFDSDTAESLSSLPRQVEDLGIDLARFAILTPYPGTRLYQKLESEGRILTRQWHRYTQNQAVFRPKHLSADALEQVYQEVWRETYRIPRILRRVRQNPRADGLVRWVTLGANLAFRSVGRQCKDQQEETD